MDKESLVGVVEAVNRLDETPSDEDDLFVLTSLYESAAIALHNASLLLAERKIEVLTDSDSRLFQQHGYVNL
jgi:hypothetical protein